MIDENAHMKKRMSRKSARGGRALLTGLVRCGRCGRMMRVFYGMRSGHAHRYDARRQRLGRHGVLHRHGGLRRGSGCHRGDYGERDLGACREAAIRTAQQATRADEDLRQAAARELEEARYEASAAARRYECVDPAKRLVARELEARWNISLERVAQLQAESHATPSPSTRVMALAQDLPAVWNAPSADARTKQRLTRVLIQEAVIDLDDASNEAVVTVHWTGGRHTEIRVARTKCGRYPEDRHPAVVVMQKLAAVTPMGVGADDALDSDVATVRVRELRERLGIAPFEVRQQPQSR